MPIEVGLLPTQQDSFEHHEELSKLLNETDVFYVPLRNELADTNFNPAKDLTDVTKRFDEDLSKKHLIVTFRDIGYSLFLDSVESIPDENDQSKIRVSGKMIVDGICVQFFGCFDHRHKSQKHPDSHAQQIIGVGRVELDEEYYRELSSAQTSLGPQIKEDEESGDTPVKPVIKPKTRQQTAKMRERTDSNRVKARSRPTSDIIMSKDQTNLPTTSPPSQSHTSSTALRSRAHSPTHMPYPLRSPRTKQHRSSSPLHFTNPSTTRVTEVHSSLRSTTSSAFSDYSPQTSSSTPSQSIEYSQLRRVPILSHSPHFSSHIIGQPTLPIQIPTSSNTGLPPTSLPQLTNPFSHPQSHSLPTYILPTANIAYIATPSTNSTGSPFELTPLTGNTSLLLITNPGQHPGQPLHILTPIDHHSLQFAHYTPTNLFPAAAPPQPSLSSSSVPSRICNILPSALTNDSMSMFQNKRHENEEDKLVQAHATATQQFTGQLPLKKRRYTAQQTRMATVHDDDDDVSDESAKK